MSSNLEPVSTVVTFTTGVLAPQSIRAELHELQKAILCRKSGTYDRRTLDPPPVLQLKLFRVTQNQNGEFVESEINYESFFYQGLVCHLEIFDAEDPEGPDGNRTTELGGERFVSASALQNSQGSMYLLFVFGNVSIYKEGTYIPRFSCYDLLSTAGSDRRPCLARNSGGAFTVYPTKACPRLPPSTELTRYLARAGVRVNTRQDAAAARLRANATGDGVVVQDGDYNADGNEQEEAE